MKIQKKDILNSLKFIKVSGDSKSIVENNFIKNIILFGDEVVIDLKINNPSLQAKKKLEVQILEIIHEKVYEKAKIKVNISVEKIDKKDSNKDSSISAISSVIAISSGKGGVGKSTLTSNISISLAKMGFKVGILDADIYGPSIPTMMDVEGSRPLSVNQDGKSKMKPIENYGIKILSIGFFTKPNQAVIWRGPMATRALKQMIFDAAWGDLDFLLIDLPPGTGDIHLSIVQSLPITGSIVISTPQNVALDSARKGIAMFNQENINVPVLGIVENMSYFSTNDIPDKKYYIFGESGAKNLSKDLKVPFLGEIPIDQSIREAADYGRPAALQKNSDISNAIDIITRNMIDQLLTRNRNLPKTQIVKIENMSGCSAIKN
ncbi:MAG: Mrp/NBP35 family ATP-binding protein [Flavobacteriaceae bacterium]|nr:Mrp/NBP35 family ATP-binding protein [Flavobacteriaceae bacterium]